MDNKQISSYEMKAHEYFSKLCNGKWISGWSYFLRLLLIGLISIPFVVGSAFIQMWLTSIGIHDDSGVIVWAGIALSYIVVTYLMSKYTAQRANHAGKNPAYWVGAYLISMIVSIIFGIQLISFIVALCMIFLPKSWELYYNVSTNTAGSWK